MTNEWSYVRSQPFADHFGLGLPPHPSRPFPRPSTGKIAVKVINDYGDEVVKVFST